ncbi:uncharacterized protein KY384_007709 [Bacidia gigantensis]|uniref:uncharacterized protein n=1 Tax=Bacidia gigantensis TaxID=2732470 RepID=UPI001D04AED0|nr:uncharacterized protein KY384_007709 [Bacidia gigantensis]KAG8527557.1 hypothetical protein KY384_007709 [Bacidia gigantensis]
MSRQRLFASDEELGKKNDDRRPDGHAATAAWTVRRPSHNIRKRKVLYWLCGALFVFLFIKNIPTDVGPHPRWADTRTYQAPVAEGKLTSPTSTPPNSKKPPRPTEPSSAQEHYHDGPIKFWQLAASLHAVAKLGGQKELNKNVLFAAASLKSVAELLPLACEMSQWERNDVHLAIMGRDDMEMRDILTINGVSEEDCNVHWHDARPDFSRWSSDFRMESSVAASLEHIQTFVHPQVILTDAPSREEQYFVNGIRGKALDLWKPLIELPLDAMKTLTWITRLDSSSLAAWPRVYIDIFIQAPSESSGSVVRLLRSVESADYFGTRRPHLTIDLPAEIDPPTWSYIENLVWPPTDWSGAPHTSQVTLRHRISRKTTTAEEASARFLEAFYPKRTMDSHVVLLSPQTELSPLYYHYLLYTVLEYRYSRHSKSNEATKNIMGISLDLPASYLDDETPFVAPIRREGKNSSDDERTQEQLPFMWQSPNSNAALYFGDKWMEFHSFLALRLTKGPSDPSKDFSKKHPAWLQYLSELMRARGYSLLYPGVFAGEFELATVHDELYKVPEELGRQITPAESYGELPAPELPLDGNATYSRSAPPNVERPLIESSLVSLLPNKGDLLETSRIPLLSFQGKFLTSQSSGQAAISHSDQFRQSTGGCDKTHSAPGHQVFKAVDLFCDPNQPFDYFKTSSPPTSEESRASTEPPPVQNKPWDADQITKEDAENARKEASHHLDRQATTEVREPDTPDKVSEAPPRSSNKGQSNKDVAGAESTEKLLATGKDEKISSSKGDGEVGVSEDQFKRGEAKVVSSTQPPARDRDITVADLKPPAKPASAFEKQKPQAPNENEVEGEDRNPGW